MSFAIAIVADIAIVSAIVAAAALWSKRKKDFREVRILHIMI